MRGAASAEREHQVLELWERTIGLDRWRRDDALLDGGTPAPRGLGARNRALLALRNTLFHHAWSLRSDCPVCTTGSEFTVDCVDLVDRLDALPATERSTIDWCGRTVVARAPTVDDLIAVAREADAARALLARCLEDAGGLPVGERATDAGAIDERAIEGLERHLEALDPAASIAFQVRCVACGHEWSSALDVGEAVAVEVQRAAERTLTEVDALARAYGWTEAEVMQLSPIRRAAYLQLVEAA